MKKLFIVLMLLCTSSCACFYKNGEYRQAEANAVLKNRKEINIFLDITSTDMKGRVTNHSDDYSINAGKKIIGDALDSYGNIKYTFVDKIEDSSLSIKMKGYWGNNNPYFLNSLISGLTLMIIPIFQTSTNDITFETNTNIKAVRTEEFTFALGGAALLALPFGMPNFHVGENMIKSGINELISKGAFE